MYKISVILPIHNTEKHLHAAITSLINQTLGFENLQVILVNDGSTDGTKQLIEQYVSEHANIESIHFDVASGAAGKPRNAGLEVAKADFVMFLDPDDTYLENTCELLYNLMIEHKSDVVVGRTQGISAQGPYEIPFSSPLLNEQHINIKIEQLVPLLQEFIHLNASIYSRAFIEKHGFTFMVGRATQDALFTEQVFLKADNITFTPELTYQYHARNDADNLSITQLRNKRYFSDLAYMVSISKELYNDHVLNYLEARYPSLIGWTLFQFSCVTGSDEHKLEIIETIKPVVQLAKDFDASIFTQDKQDLITHFLNDDIAQILQCMGQQDNGVDMK